MNRDMSYRLLIIFILLFSASAATSLADVPAPTTAKSEGSSSAPPPSGDLPLQIIGLRQNSTDAPIDGEERFRPAISGKVIAESAQGEADDRRRDQP